MPLINIDIYNTWTKHELKILTDNIHLAVVKNFEVPENDRYQIIHQHKENEMTLLDTGLGFERDSGSEVVIQIISRKRTTSAKLAFYQDVADTLQANLDLNPKNLLITIMENDDADWSFGYGKAQFCTGELG